MTEPLVVVYKATNRVNGDFYIGYTGRGLANREKTHRQTAAKEKGRYRLHNAMRKYGQENFVFEIMADFEGDEDLAKLYECEAIAAYKPAYNLTYGGEGGTLAAESRAKIGAANRGKKKPPSFTEKRVAFLTGRKHTPETRVLMSRVQKGHPGHNKGGTLSEETRAKISAANKGQVPWITGKKHSEETKQKIRSARWSHTPESIERIKASRKKAWTEPSEAMLAAVRRNNAKAQEARSLKVVCVDDGEVFASCSKADAFYGYRVGLVSRILKGTKKWPLTVVPRVFRFVED